MHELKLEFRWRGAGSQRRDLTAQQAYNVVMATYRRRCDVITSHRRQYDVIPTCGQWVGYT